MRTYHNTPQPGSSQADKSHIRYLEHRRRALLRELDKVNSELRARSSARRVAVDHELVLLEISAMQRAVGAL